MKTKTAAVPGAKSVPRDMNGMSKLAMTTDSWASLPELDKLERRWLRTGGTTGGKWRLNLPRCVCWAGTGATLSALNGNVYAPRERGDLFRAGPPTGTHSV